MNRFEQRMQGAKDMQEFRAKPHAGDSPETAAAKMAKLRSQDRESKFTGQFNEEFAEAFPAAKDTIMQIKGIDDRTKIRLFNELMNTPTVEMVKEYKPMEDGSIKEYVSKWMKNLTKKLVAKSQQTAEEVQGDQRREEDWEQNAFDGK